MRDNIIHYIFFTLGPATEALETSLLFSRFRKDFVITITTSTLPIYYCDWSEHVTIPVPTIARSYKIIPIPTQSSVTWGCFWDCSRWRGCCPHPQCPPPLPNFRCWWRDPLRVFRCTSVTSNINIGWKAVWKQCFGSGSVVSLSYGVPRSVRIHYYLYGTKDLDPESVKQSTSKLFLKKTVISTVLWPLPFLWRLR
jgi:hypothetical protein